MYNLKHKYEHSNITLNSCYFLSMFLDFILVMIPLLFQQSEALERNNINNHLTWSKEPQNSAAQDNSDEKKSFTTYYQSVITQNIPPVLYMGSR